MRLLSRTFFLTLAAASLANGASAQQPATPDRSLSFVYLRGADTLGIETVTPGMPFRGVQQMKGQPIIAWEQEHTDQVPGALILKVFAPGAAANAAPAQMLRFTPRSDSIVVDMRTAAANRTQTMVSKPGAVSLIGSSVLHAALLSQHARAKGRSVLPVFVTAGGQTFDASVAANGDTTFFAVAGQTMRITWGADGAPTDIRVDAQGLRVMRATSPVTIATAARISYDAPADAPYVAEHVTIPTVRGYTLAGTLTRPKGSTKVPVVVTVSGSGPQDRDSRISIVEGYAPFREIADTLARRGIAVLRYDDRGVGESGGRSSRDSATSADFADDVQSVLAYLRTRADVDGTRLAVAGHSEGGLIAPLVAMREPTVAAIALLAGPSQNGRQILTYQNANNIAVAPGLTDVQRDSLRRTIPAALDSLARSNRWMNYFMAYDPLATARRVKQPVLILQGDTDRQVTAEQADTLVGAFRAGGNRRVTMRHFPETNHLFLTDPSGAPQGYTSLADRRIRRDVLGALADWFVTTLRP